MKQHSFKVWVLFAGVILIMAYFAYFEDNQEALQGLVGYAWFCIAGTLGLFSKTVRRNIKYGYRPVPWWTDTGAEIGIGLFLVGSGYYWTGLALIIHSVIFAAVFLKKR